MFYFRSNTFRCRFEKPFLNFHLTKLKCGIRDEITRISGNVNSTSGAQFALCHQSRLEICTWILCSHSGWFGLHVFLIIVQLV